MASASREAVETQIERLFRDGTLTSHSDAELLDRYLSVRDEAAFEALVNLHGPMVLGLCRRMLRDPSDIDDAFQATFLVLVRKAPAIRNRGLLANWLYGVAYRVAVRARGNLLRKRAREMCLGEIETPAMSDHDHPEEVPPALDQELNRLPARYRVPLVLCYLKGLTHDQAAEQLRCPVGTVRSRLARGRDLLRRRLTVRGYASSAGLPGTALPAPAVPASLVRATIEAATRFSAGQGVAAAMAASAVETLAEGALKTMVRSRFKTIGLSLLALAMTSGAVVGVVLVSSHRARRVPPEPPPVAQPKTPEPEKVTLSPPRKLKPRDWVQIEVLEALPGRPISGIREVRPDGTIGLGFYGDVQVAGLDRNQIKAKVVNHLRKFLTDEVLGLIEIDPATGGPLYVSTSQGEAIKRIKPVDSDRVFVEDSVDAYAPTPVEKRLVQIEETLEDLSGRLGDISRQMNIEPYSRPAPQMSQLLAAQRANYEAQLKLASAGMASQSDIDQSRSAYEASKRLIPQLVVDARKRLEVAKYIPAIDEKDPQYEARLRAAKSRLDERRRLNKEGKIPEEEVWDAEGEYQLLSSNLLYGESTSTERRKAEICAAQSDLELAEQLQSKYLNTPEKPTAKEAKAK